jgi:hypothetical protein
VGTDPGQFEDLRRYAITGQLSSRLPPPYQGKDIIPTGALYLFLQQKILAKALAPLNLNEDESIAIHSYREFPLPPPPIGVYKAAPRDGVWATPPFLHNGSVPNLYEMLIPAKERTKKFYIGGSSILSKWGSIRAESLGISWWTRHRSGIRTEVTLLRTVLVGTASSARS